MPKVTIEVPEGFEDSVKALEETLQPAQKGVAGAETGDLAAFDAAWQAVNAGVVNCSSTGTSRSPQPRTSARCCYLEGH